MKKYNDIVRKISDAIIEKLDAENASFIEEDPNHSYEGYDIWYDDQAVSEAITDGVAVYAKENSWYGQVHNRHGKLEENLTLPASQFIAGNSPSIEESFDGQYRKDMFRDVALGAIYNDIVIELRKKYPEMDCYDFCSRGN